MITLFPTNTAPVTQDEIDKIVATSPGKLDGTFCTLLVHYMQGYLRHAHDHEATRQAFFQQIRQELEGAK